MYRRYQGLVWLDRQDHAAVLDRPPPLDLDNNNLDIQQVEEAEEEEQAEVIAEED